MPKHSASKLFGLAGLRSSCSRALFFSCVAMISRPLVAAGADTPLQQILSEFTKLKHGHVHFQEQIESPMLKAPIVTSGELFFDAPDRLEKRTLFPTPNDLILEGNQVSIVHGTTSRSFRLSEYPQLRPLLDGIRATLAGDLPTLEQNFLIAVSLSSESWTLIFRPLPSEATPAYESIVVRGNAGKIREVTLERRPGERSHMIMTEPAQS